VPGIAAAFYLEFFAVTVQQEWSLKVWLLTTNPVKSTWHLFRLYLHGYTYIFAQSNLRQCDCRLPWDVQVILYCITNSLLLYVTNLLWGQETLSVLWLLSNNVVFTVHFASDLALIECSGPAFDTPSPETWSPVKPCPIYSYQTPALMPVRLSPRDETILIWLGRPIQLIFHELPGHIHSFLVLY